MFGMLCTRLMILTHGESPTLCAEVALSGGTQGVISPTCSSAFKDVLEPERNSREERWRSVACHA